MNRILSVAAILIALGRAAPAQAESGKGAENLTPPPLPASWGPPPEQEVKRSCVMISFQAVGGAIGGIDGLASGLGMAAQFGYNLRSDLFVGLNFAGFSHSDGVLSSPKYTVGTLGPVVRYWALPRVWLTGGGGVAHMTMPDPSGESSGMASDGVALFAGAGYEVLHGPGGSLDLTLRATTAFLEDKEPSMVSLGVGVSFFGIKK